MDVLLPIYAMHENEPVRLFSLASMKGLSLISEHSADWVAKYEKNADLETAKAVTEDTVEVSDHQSFLDAVYLMALNRQLSGTFYYKGDYNDIFHFFTFLFTSLSCCADSRYLILIVIVESSYGFK